MIAPVAWYLLLTVLGWLAFPIAYRLLPGLRDRGYAISRPLGLLIWGYLFWMLASLGVLRNDLGGLIFAAALLAGLGLWALRGTHPAEVRDWLRSQLRLVLSVEALFLIAFAAWAFVRAANPEAVGTEKPMELAFINAILRSPTFPPHDPWLSGYAISYYYFGYVLVAMLAQLTATPGAVAFNLGVISIFSMSATGAYSLVYNLMNALHWPLADPSASRQPPRYTLAALFGPLYLLLVSNLEGFLQVLHNRGLFWSQNAAGEWTSPFWSWLDIKELNAAPQPPLTWVPTRFWWWWRASRVVQDYDLAGNAKEIIDEFPFFSFLLSDLHPHVLAIPFGLLAISLALNLFLGGGRRPELRQIRLPARTLVSIALFAAALGLLLTGLGIWKTRLPIALLGLVLAALGGAGYVLGDSRAQSPDPWLEYRLPIRPAVFALAALALGGMAFLNTWDFPLYVALAAAAFALQDAWPDGKPLGQILGQFVGMGIALGVTSVLLYLPFYLSFSSQAGGVIPNVIFPTRGAHLWVMFGSLLVPIFAFLFYQARREQRRLPGAVSGGLKTALGFTLALWLLSLATGLLAANLPGALNQVSQIFMGSLAASNSRQIFVAAVLRRLTQPGGWITLVALIGLALACLWGSWRKNDGRRTTEESEGVAGEPLQSSDDSLETSDDREPAADAAAVENATLIEATPMEALPMEATPGWTFGALLALFGGLLVLAIEFFFLRDLFGTRMNTIFKFYYQAWLLWSVLAAFASVALLQALPRRWNALFELILVFMLAAGLVYPPLSLWNKTNGFQPSEWTLDSTAYLVRSNPDEMRAIDWLHAAPLGVVAEAGKGDAYSEYGRVATLSGQPAVIGWINHENQWRGEASGAAIGSRPADIERLYCSRNWEEARAVLERYQIRYIFVGGLERATYSPSNPACPLGLVEAKFIRNLKPVFQAGDVAIYEYNGTGNE